MNQIDIAAVMPLIQIRENSLVTTSKDVAELFGKRHGDVLRKIDSLNNELPADMCERNFALTEFVVRLPSGGQREDTGYYITRDGFTLLAMGFTGKKALQFKLAYIEAFNQMEAQLQQAERPALQYQRMLMTIEAGCVTSATPVPDNSVVVSPDNVHRLMMETTVTDEALVNMITVCTQRLAQRAEARARHLDTQERHYLAKIRRLS